MMHLYKTIIKLNCNISLEDYEILFRKTYEFLIEYDKFKNDNYHKIFYNSFMRKFKYSQEYIARDLGMDQSTISRKLNEIRNYIMLKINETK